MNNFPPFIPAEQLQRMITNALLQGLKQGPGAAPFNPIPYQQYDQTQQLNNLSDNLPSN